MTGVQTCALPIYHSGRDVHIIDLLGVDLQDVVAAAGRNAGALEVLGLVQRLVGLSNDCLLYTSRCV